MITAFTITAKLFFAITFLRQFYFLATRVLNYSSVENCSFYPKEEKKYKEKQLVIWVFLILSGVSIALIKKGDTFGNIILLVFSFTSSILSLIIIQSQKKYSFFLKEFRPNVVQSEVNLTQKQIEDLNEKINDIPLINIYPTNDPFIKLLKENLKDEIKYRDLEPLKESHDKLVNDNYMTPDWELLKEYMRCNKNNTERKINWTLKRGEAINQTSLIHLAMVIHPFIKSENRLCSLPFFRSVLK